jgi:hypothetical protein
MKENNTKNKENELKSFFLQNILMKAISKGK